MGHLRGLSLNVLKSCFYNRTYIFHKISLIPGYIADRFSLLMMLFLEKTEPLTIVLIKQDHRINMIIIHLS